MSLEIKTLRLDPEIEALDRLLYLMLQIDKLSAEELKQVEMRVAIRLMELTR